MDPLCSDSPCVRLSSPCPPPLMRCGVPGVPYSHLCQPRSAVASWMAACGACLCVGRRCLCVSGATVSVPGPGFLAQGVRAAVGGVTPSAARFPARASAGCRAVLCFARLVCCSLRPVCPGSQQGLAVARWLPPASSGASASERRRVRKRHVAGPDGAQALYAVTLTAAVVVRTVRRTSACGPCAQCLRAAGAARLDGVHSSVAWHPYCGRFPVAPRQYRGPWVLYGTLRLRPVRWRGSPPSVAARGCCRRRRVAGARCPFRCVHAPYWWR